MLAVFVVNSVIVALVVIVHYEFLFKLTALLPSIHIRQRFRIVLGVFVALFAHVLEIWISYYYMHQADGWGTLTGNFNGSLMDCAYYSFTAYTSLGFGDIVPFGDLRYLSGIEALTGLVMISWTASFLYFEMQRYWNAR